MQEPHQRTQSGKLRVVSRRSNSESAITLSRTSNNEYVGIQSASKLNETNYDDSLECYLQTPRELSSLHLQLLAKIAKGYGIIDNNSADAYWRRTWNIGTWCIGNDVSISINIMQPNISAIMAKVVCNPNEDMDKIISEFKLESLAKSTAHATYIGKGYQLMGRWTLHILEKFITLGFIKEDNIELSGANIGQSRIFCWLLVGKESEYLCTLTKQSGEELMRYLPDWCGDIREASSAADITLRIKDPKVPNDSTALFITTSGFIRYQGALHHISKLPEALSIALRSIMSSVRVSTFLDSLEYKELSNGF